MSVLDNLNDHIRDAVENFWLTRESQRTKQVSSGRVDSGTRGAATGGKRRFEKLGKLSRDNL